jgi:excisionase family DNA binding protein
MTTRPLTVREAADALGLSVHTVRAWIFQRRLTHVRLGRAIRILPSAVEELLKNATVQSLRVNDLRIGTNTNLPRGGIPNRGSGTRLRGDPE